MNGFIGVRAKRKKRNITIFLILVVIFLIILYIIPAFKLNDTMPIDTLLPSLEETVTSEILTNEELELKLFDRDKKIIFRNNEIKKIREELKIQVEENRQLSSSILNLNKQNNLTSSNAEDFQNTNIQLEKIKKDNKKELQRVNDLILKITKEKNDLIKNIEKVSSENELSIKEYKMIIKKNMQLTSVKNSLSKKIKEQTDEIKDLNISIQILKDSFHHR